MSDEALDRISDALFRIAATLEKLEPLIEAVGIVLMEEAEDIKAQAKEIKKHGRIGAAA